MKKFDKKDIAGMMLSAGVGVVTYMIYHVGKCAGKIDAYSDCSNQLKTIVEACKDIKPTE